MDDKRKCELIAYAAVCFGHGTSPFETMHLSKKNVKLDECIELSHLIANILEDELDYIACIDALAKRGGKLGRDWIKDAEKEFAETQ